MFKNLITYLLQILCELLSVDLGKVKAEKKEEERNDGSAVGKENSKTEKNDKCAEESCIAEEVEPENSHKLREEEEEANEEEREEVDSPTKQIACRWMRCKRRFSDDNQLYDHLFTVSGKGKWRSSLANEEHHN